MDTMAESEQMEKRAQEVKLILRRLIAEVEAAEEQAADTDWEEEKAQIICGTLSSVSWRLSNLAYDLGFSGGTLLNKQEQEAE